MAKRPRRSTGFEAWLNAAQTPMYLLDKRRQVTIFNRGCETLTGWTANEIVGGLCDYASPPDDAPLDRFLASLCPPPSVYEGESLQAPAFLPTKGGGAESRMLHHFSMANRDGVIDRVLTFMLPIRNPPVVNTVSAAQKLHAELASLRLSLRERYGFSTVVTASDSMHRVIRQIRLAAESTASVHLVGEPGTGREHLARVSHNEGELKSTSFVPLDCQRLSAVELLNTVRRLFDNQPGETGNLPHLQTGTLFFQS
ncbi:MAG: sigma 54-interacting transcriptional regulator, partial [Planctomycetaceae bacterium]